MKVYRCKFDRKDMKNQYKEALAYQKEIISKKFFAFLI